MGDSYPYSQSQAIIGLGSLGQGGAVSTIDKFVAVTVTDTTPGLLQDKMQAGDSYISFTVANPSGNAIYKTLLNIANLVTGLTGKFIRNQASASSTSEDDPGHILLSKTGSLSIGLNDPATLKQLLYFDKSVIELLDSTLTPSQMMNVSASQIGFGGADSISFGYSNTFWQPSIPGKWYPFQANPTKTEGYSFPRLKWLLSATDTIQAELPNKLVDGNGVVFGMVVSGTLGQQIQIPTGVIAGTPNGQQLFAYSLTESTNAISRTGTSTGDNSGTRGFAFVSDSSRPMSKMRIAIQQTGGTLCRLGVYDASGILLGKTNQFAPSVGILTVPLIAPVALVGGNIYYLAYWTNDTTANLTFFCLSGRSVATTSPLMQRHDPNEMPNSIASALSNTQFRPWLMCSE
jgi:hypothetical protein